jgi:poly(A) polymerase
MPSQPELISDALSAMPDRTFVVGGAVRDLMLGIAPADLDLTTAMDPARTADMLAEKVGGTAVPLDRTRGYFRTVIPGEGPGLRWIDISPPDGDIEADLARRDFSIDAMAMPLSAWLHERQEVVTRHAPPTAPEDMPGLIDPYGGLKDMQNGQIRETTPGNLFDDPVRIVKAARLSAALEFDVEKVTVAAARECAHMIAGQSPERVRDEIYGLFATERAMRGVRELDRLCALSVIFPELDDCRNVQQSPNHHHWDVFNHMVETIGKLEILLDSSTRTNDHLLAAAPWPENFETHLSEVVGDGLTRRTVLKLTGLLHDISKPETKTIDDDGRMRFFRHPDDGAVKAEEMLRRLRCSRRVTSRISLMIREHLRPSQISNNRAKPSNRALVRYYADLGDAAMDVVVLNMADYLAARGPDINASDWEGFRGPLGDILNPAFEEPGNSKASLLLNGNDIQCHFGLQSGPGIGRLLKLLAKAEAEGLIETQAEALNMLESVLARTERPSGSDE